MAQPQAPGVACPISRETLAGVLPEINAAIEGGTVPRQSPQEAFDDWGVSRFPDDQPTPPAPVQAPRRRPGR